MPTQDWDRYKSTAKVLVIGHDPRLQKSDTIADYCFFANYYFDKVRDPQYQRKRGLAKGVFDFVHYVSDGGFKETEVYITNLCNDALPPAPKGKTVFIPKNKAEGGLERIRKILTETDIEIIFAMSEQVNYWLQELGFYNSENGFRKDAKPSKQGTTVRPHYYLPTERGSFKKICGNEYKTDSQNSIFPILHVKNYPLKGKFLTYRPNYEQMKATVVASMPTKSKGTLKK